MIVANARQRLTPADVELVLQVLAKGDAGRRSALERRLEREGLDALLDEPGLLEGLVGHRALESPSAALFLYVVVRQALRRSGVDDVAVSDYLTALLLDFGAGRRAWRIQPHDDDEFSYLTDILVALETASGRREFLLRAHLGNFSLWLVGVFPDYIAARRQRKGGPDLGYYEALGAQGFRLARDHPLAEQYELTGVYDLAAEAFSRLRVALNELSDRWLFPNWNSPARLMRQVLDGR